MIGLAFIHKLNGFMRKLLDLFLSERDRACFYAEVIGLVSVRKLFFFIVT